MNRPFTYLAGVATLQLEPDKCVGCGLCLEVCPQAVLRLQDSKAIIAELDACMECGACMTNCPTGALWVQVGVGCAQAVINSALGRRSSSCCCVIEEPGQNKGAPSPGCGPSCC